MNKSACIAFVLLLSGSGASVAAGVSAKEVISTYGDIAAAGYSDSLATAKVLQSAIDAMLESPSQESLELARQAWIAARVPYQQTEVYRFGNSIVDDWEGKVNAWPLDEGLIDYVDASYGAESEDNDFYTMNVVANPKLIVNGSDIDASAITPALLSDQLHEAGGVEANVATGYHAIEFLLWGQDLNGGEAGAGNRRYTDFDVDNCTNSNCDRRGEYLSAASALLITDLEEMVRAWSAGGEARVALDEAGEAGALTAMLTGMGSLSYGELAGERMQLGLMLHDPEEEHDCFADNTSASHYYDGVGIQNVFLGKYRKVDGSMVEGASLQAMLMEKNSVLADELTAEIAASVGALGVLLDSQNNGMAYDQLIAEGNTEGNQKVQAAIDSLVVQTRSIERAVAALDLAGVAIEGSDSLDDPSAVFK